MLTYFIKPLVNLTLFIHLGHKYGLDFIISIVRIGRVRDKILLESFFELRRVSFSMQIKNM